MHVPSLLFAATACMRIAYADFLILTEPPIPTTLIPSFTNTADAASWTTSVFFNFKVKWNAYTGSLGSTWQSSLTSVHSEVASFASAHANYSIPAGVTDDSKTETIFGKPDWYTALPSDVRSFKEAEYTMQKSVLASVIGGAGGASATKTSSVGRPTGVMAADLGLGVGFAAVAAGAAFF